MRARAPLLPRAGRRFNAAVKSLPMLLGAAVLGLAACAAPAAQKPSLGQAGQLAHAVFFDLVDDGQAGALVSDCHRRLSTIPGVLLLEAGTRAPEFSGPRNDNRFDVALWVLFEDRAAHDAYQVHPEHRALVEEWTPRLAGVEVCDAWLAD